MTGRGRVRVGWSIPRQVVEGSRQTDRQTDRQADRQKQNNDFVPCVEQRSMARLTDVEKPDKAFFCWLVLSLDEN